MAGHLWSVGPTLDSPALTGTVSLGIQHCFSFEDTSDYTVIIYSQLKDSSVEILFQVQVLQFQIN